jgi:hypothetical protein
VVRLNRRFVTPQLGICNPTIFTTCQKTHLSRRVDALYFMSKFLRLFSVQARRQCSNPPRPQLALPRIPKPIPPRTRSIMTAPPTSQDGRDLIFVRSLNL